MQAVTLNEVKKGAKVRVRLLGSTVSGVMMDNLRGNTRMVDVKGSEVGLFDEIGSVYAADILEAEVNGEWLKVAHTDKQLAAKRISDQLFS